MTEGESPPDATGSRHKILVAAAELLSEDPTSRLSVRSVAARAGVSTGSLRHHFPTQRALRDAVLEGIYSVVAPDEPIRDSSAPAHDRLLAGLRHVVGLVGTGEQARRAWVTAYRSFVEPEPTPALVEAHRALGAQLLHRVEHWLGVLEQEGALPPGDITRRAQFLVAVINGLSSERGFPGGESALLVENEVLVTAVEAVLGPWPGGA